LKFEKLSKSTNEDKSLFESRTKGEGSSGLSSNMASGTKKRRVSPGLLSDVPCPIQPRSLALTMHLDAQIFQRLHPKAYLERFLADHFRPDGREPSEWRDLFLHVGSISTADGSALVRIGETTIVCGVKAEIAEPDLEQPTEGFLGSHVQ
jgi:polyribonucleotide nucleotidyltransferase